MSKRRMGTPSRKTAKRADNKEALEVVCRLCPYTGGDPCAVYIDEQYIKLQTPATLIRNGMAANEMVYKFSYVFDDMDSQKAVFDRTAVDLVERLVKGSNSLLFTYGITGGGKTYTMTGSTSEDTAGILPRTLDVVFNSLPNIVDKCIFKRNGRNGFEVASEFEATVARRKMQTSQQTSSIELANRYVEHKRVSGVNSEMLCAVFVSYIEIYNDFCYDLLDNLVTNRDGSRSLASKELRLAPNGAIYLENIIEVEVDSSNEALEQFFLGQERRKFGDTLLNKQSSRSHSIFSIRLVMAPCQFDVFHPVEDPSMVHVSQLSLVDLAGSERTKRTGNEGTRLIESSKINQSLLVLRQCFEKLRENQRNIGAPIPVPYRESKLTHIFKNFFEGTGKVRMIVCLNPRPHDYPENLNVLNFAEVTQNIETVRDQQLPFTVSDTLPIGRREFIKWCNEIDKDLLSTEDDRMCVTINPPSIDINGSKDGESIARLRSYYQKLLQTSIAIASDFEQKSNDYEMQLRRVLCYMDLQVQQNRDFVTERDEAERSITTLTAQLRQTRRENQALRYRILRYEDEENEKLSQDEEQRRRERGLKEQLRKKDETLHQVREIFQKPTFALNRHASTEQINRNQKEPEQNKRAEIDPLPYSRVRDRVNRFESNRNRNTPQVATKVGTHNPHFKRRSKSAFGRIVDHQPRNRIPEGTVMRPRYVKNVKQTTIPDASDLKKSSEYLLTHQEIDQKGNLSTQLVKGDCIPTAGGGTTVLFRDVEHLSHETPF